MTSSIEDPFDHISRFLLEDNKPEGRRSSYYSPSLAVRIDDLGTAEDISKFFIKGITRLQILDEEERLEEVRQKWNRIRRVQTNWRLTNRFTKVRRDWYRKKTDYFRSRRTKIHDIIKRSINKYFNQ